MRHPVPVRQLPLAVVAALLVAACSSGGASSSASPAANAPASVAATAAASAATAAPATASAAPSAAPSASAPASAGPARSIGLMLSYIPSVQFFPPLLADGLGYFAEEGLDVDIQPSEGSSFVVQQVAGGNVDTGLPASQAVLLGFRQSPDFKAVYQFANQSFGIYVLDSSPIQSVADLKGKKVGAPDLAGGEMLALRIELERAGLAQGTDVTVEALGYNELGMAEAVQAGRVAALSIYWSTSAIADHAGIPLRCLTCESEKPQVGMALIVSSNLLASDRQAIAGLGRALAKATHFAWSNPDAAVAVLQKVNPEGSTDVEQLKASMAVAIKAIAPAEGVQYGANDLDAWQALMEGMLNPGSQSGLDQPVDVQALVDNSLVAEFNDFDHDAVKAQAESYQP